MQMQIKYEKLKDIYMDNISYHLTGNTSAFTSGIIFQ